MTAAASIRTKSGRAPRCRGNGRWDGQRGAPEVGCRVQMTVRSGGKTRLPAGC